MGFYSDFQGEWRLFHYIHYFVITHFAITRFKCILFIVQAVLKGHIFHGIVSQNENLRHLPVVIHKKHVGGFSSGHSGRRASLSWSVHRRGFFISVPKIKLCLVLCVVHNNKLSLLQQPSFLFLYCHPWCTRLLGATGVQSFWRFWRPHYFLLVYYLSCWVLFLFCFFTSSTMSRAEDNFCKLLLDMKLLPCCEDS